MKHLVFLAGVLLQLCLLANAQAWTFPEFYRDNGVFLEECTLSTASSDDSEEANENEDQAEEEEPDCD